MPLYEYECPRCGVTEVLFSMRDRPSAIQCPTCGGEASFIMSAPALPSTARPLRSALERAEKSRHEPTIARRGASQGGHQAVNPKLQRLVGKEAAKRARIIQNPANPRARHAHPHPH